MYYIDLIQDMEHPRITKHGKLPDFRMESWRSDQAHAQQPRLPGGPGNGRCVFVELCHETSEVTGRTISRGVIWLVVTGCHCCIIHL